MSNMILTRRDALIVGGATALHAALCLTACQSTSSAATRPENREDEAADPVEQQQESVEDRAVDEAQNSPSNDNADASNSETTGELDCTDTEGLTDSEIKVRESLKYTDETPKPDQTCDNCKLWKPVEEEGTCGGCKIIAGPIHPDGWCTAWLTSS